MKLFYHIDENCYNLRDFVPTLKEIHKDRGVKDVRIIMTASEFFRETGFRYEDRDIYLAGLRSGERNNYLLRNYELFNLRQPISESRVFESTFVRQIKKFLDHREAPYSERGPRLAIAEDINHHAQYLIEKYAPQLREDASMFEPGDTHHVRLRLYPPVADDPEDEVDANRRIKHAIMLAAFMRSTLFNKAAKSNSDHYKHISNDIVDREIQDYISKSFIAQGKDKTINFINVTNDVDHYNWVRGIIEESHRTGQSFNMNGYVFKASCEALAKQLRAAGEPLKHELYENWAERLEAVARRVKEDKREHSANEYVQYVGARVSGRG